MSELKIFEHSEFGKIRTVEIDGQPWLVGKDVARALGYANTKDALAKHVDQEDKRGAQIATPSGEQNMTVINESGLYSLVLSSKLPGAKKFKRWVTSEVLPSIRKHGAYIAPGTQPEAAALEALTAILQDLVRRVEAVEQGRNELKALPPGDEGAGTTPGVASQRRWMRTVTEKLDLLSNKYNRPHNLILSKIYKDMEEKFDTVMEDERYHTMEEQGLERCSILLAIFFDPELRDYFQRYVDYNLAPENQGW